MKMLLLLQDLINVPMKTVEIIHTLLKLIRLNMADVI